jgi:hypothetical protein
MNLIDQHVTIMKNVNMVFFWGSADATAANNSTLYYLNIVN